VFLAGVGLLVALVAVGSAPPPDRSGASAGAQRENLSQWEYFQTVRVPAGIKLADLIVSSPVFGRSKRGLEDLRLVDSKGQPIPYALRVLRTSDEQVLVPATEFNRTKASLSLDLGETPGEHNEIQVSLSDKGPREYRRPLRLEGSADNKTWNDLPLKDAYVVHLTVRGRLIEQRRFPYPPSRLRYLKVTVQPDRSLEKDDPEIRRAEVFRTTPIKGEDIGIPASLERREPGRDSWRGESPFTSAWWIDLGEEGVPCEKLMLEIANPDFTRSYRVETLSADGSSYAVADGELRRRAGQPEGPLTILFNTETRSRRLRLTITDHRNSPLDLMRVTAVAPARQIVFAPPPEGGELRLYFGNPNAPAPNYDFAASLTGKLPPLHRSDVGHVETNPEYHEPEKPLTERWPYLVDVVLGAASAVLVVLLLMLARSAIRRHDATPTATVS